MQQIHIATLFLSVALLGQVGLSQLEYYPCLSPLAHLPDPAMAMPSSAVTFNHFFCCGCYDRCPGSRSTSTFATYKAAATHIGRSVLCQREGVRTVTMQYRPSGRAEDQEAGAIGAAGAWPVRPAAPPAAAPGKFSQGSILHTMFKKLS